MDTTPPMTVNAFNRIFDEDLENKVLNRSIAKANDAAVHYLRNALDKLVRHQGSQTMSIEELFEDYNK